MAANQRETDEKAALWGIVRDTMDLARVELKEHSIKIAVLETRIGLIMAISGAIGGIIGSVAAGVVVFFLKR